MKFEWDKDKSLSNRKKHGLTFEAARDLWLDEKRVEIEIDYPEEKRWALIAELKGKVWTAIYTVRNEVIRLISVRRARVKEVGLYEDKRVG
jgi:uncharacterized DUF497 family protein